MDEAMEIESTADSNINAEKEIQPPNDENEHNTDDQSNSKNITNDLELDMDENTVGKDLNEDELLKDDEEQQVESNSKKRDEGKSLLTETNEEKTSEDDTSTNMNELEDNKDNEKEEMEIDENSKSEEHSKDTEENTRNESLIDENINSYKNQDENNKNSIINQDENSRNSIINQDESSRNSIINQDENSRNSIINQDENSRNSIINQDENSRNSIINQDENSRNSIINQDENSRNSIINQDENSRNSIINQDENSRNSIINQDENSRNSITNQNENSKNSTMNQDENSIINQDDNSKNLNEDENSKNLNEDENSKNLNEDENSKNLNEDENSKNLNEDENSKNLNEDENNKNLNEDENSKNLNDDENSKNLNEDENSKNSNINLEENIKECVNQDKSKHSKENPPEIEIDDDSQSDTMSVDPESIMNMCSTEFVEGQNNDMPSEFVQVQLMDDDSSPMEVDENDSIIKQESNNKDESKTNNPVDPLMSSSVVFAEIRNLEPSANETITGDGEEQQPKITIQSANKDEEEMCIVPDLMPDIIPVEESSSESPIKPTIEIDSLVGKSKVINETEDSTTKKITIKKLDSGTKDKIKASQKTQICHMCRENKPSRFMICVGDETRYLCGEECVETFKKNVSKQQSFGSTMDFISQKEPEPRTKITGTPRKCAFCHVHSNLESNIFICWETMEFCNEICLESYQKNLGSKCSNCQGKVCDISLGKYCVRFGSDIKQFCSAVCLDEFKKGLKVCSYCQKDISKNKDGFLAPIGDKGQFKEFCTQNCMEEYERMSSNLPPPEITDDCSVCNKKNTKINKEIIDKDKTHMLCSEPCFAAFKFVNPIVIDKCVMCKKCFNREITDDYKVCFNKSINIFCSKTCMNVFILAYRKIICCGWCKVKKYNFDMIHYEVNSQKMFLCSLNCIKLYNVSIKACTSKRVKCHNCTKISIAQFHIAMSDATLRNFCSYDCVQNYQTQFSNNPSATAPLLSNIIHKGEPRPLGLPKRVSPREKNLTISSLDVSSNMSSGSLQNIEEQIIRLERGSWQLNNDKNIFQESSILKSKLLSFKEKDSTNNGQDFNYDPLKSLSKMNKSQQENEIEVLNKPDSDCILPDNNKVTVYKEIVIIKPEAPKQRRNVSTMCYPNSFVVETQTSSPSPIKKTCDASTQTDGDKYKLNFPIPVPIPIYVPCPFFMYSLPYPQPFPFPLPLPVPIFIPTTHQTYKSLEKDIQHILKKIPSNPYEADLIKMAEAVACEQESIASQSGNEDDSNEIDRISNEDNTETQPINDKSNENEDVPDAKTENLDMDTTLIHSENNSPPKTTLDNKDEASNNLNIVVPTKGRRGRPRKIKPPEETKEMTIKPTNLRKIKDTSKMKSSSETNTLNSSLGVAAFNYWIKEKNEELTKSNTRPFKTELLQMTTEELNFLLCMFIKELRNQEGMEFTPDTIYYLCLGIQHHLFEHGRIENIFTNPYFETFTDTLDILALKFLNTFQDSVEVITRLEENFLWETKQLGAHSPYVLLNTLIYFNTKYFNLTTIEEHMNISFAHILKHYQKPMTQIQMLANKNSRNLLLRFYPTQEDLRKNRKKAFEQYENEENPMRCPVRLYEFYLSKCPESAKSRMDVFYMMPEHSCAPESPVWYSTNPLPEKSMAKMLNRIKMFKEINNAIIKNNEY